MKIPPLILLQLPLAEMARHLRGGHRPPAQGELRPGEQCLGAGTRRGGGRGEFWRGGAQPGALPPLVALQGRHAPAVQLGAQQPVLRGDGRHRRVRRGQGTATAVGERGRDVPANS